MSVHTLAVVALILLVLRVGIKIGLPLEEKPLTLERRILALVDLAYVAFVIWLLVAVLT